MERPNDPARVFLLPGELYVSKAPTEIATLLGSCVGICLFNRRHNFGGMNHYMLANAPERDSPSGKHGDYSTNLLIQMMLSHDSVIGNLEATVVGGGNVVGHLTSGEGIGIKNIRMAYDLLEKARIRVVDKQTGGEFGRKVHFKNWSGEIEIRKIEKSESTLILEKKRKDISSRKIKVLVVDDSKIVRSILVKAISNDPGLTVVGAAADPYEAREMLLEHDPDVICLDIIMPRMDGITFLKKLFLYKPKPVIIISTVAQEGSKLREQAQKIGAVEVIDKEDLTLYAGGVDHITRILSGKIKLASSVWVKKKTAEELNSM